MHCRASIVYFNINHCKSFDKLSVYASMVPITIKVLKPFDLFVKYLNTLALLCTKTGTDTYILIGPTDHYATLKSVANQVL